MRSIPVDVSRVSFIGTGKTASRAEYVELSDGSRRASGNQAKQEETGLPLWVVDVLVDDDTARRAEVVGVVVASYDEPVTQKWQPVRFRGLVATIYADRASGQAKVSLKAEGIETDAKFKPQPVASAG